MTTSGRSRRTSLAGSSEDHQRVQREQAERTATLARLAPAFHELRPVLNDLNRCWNPEGGVGACRLAPSVGDLRRPGHTAQPVGRDATRTPLTSRRAAGPGD